jgi:transketolase
LQECIDACNELDKLGIDAELLHIPFVKPFDKDSVIESAKKTGLVVTVENHSVKGALGSAVCEILSENLPTKVLRIGVNDSFGMSGTSDELLKHFGLDAKSIVKRIVEIRK